MTRIELEKHVIAHNEALIAAEQFAISMLPLLKAVTEVGGMEKAIIILNSARFPHFYLERKKS